MWNGTFRTYSYIHSHSPLLIGFVKNGIALLRTSYCLLWRNWSAILGLWDYRSTFSTFSGMADGGFCDFPPGVDSSIIAQMFHERAAAQSFGKTVHSKKIPVFSTRCPWLDQSGGHIGSWTVNISYWPLYNATLRNRYTLICLVERFEAN